MEGIDQHAKKILNARIEEVAMQYREYVDKHY